MALQQPLEHVLTAPRRDERWRFDLLDLEGNFQTELDGVIGGSLDFSIHNTIRSGGSLDYNGDPFRCSHARIRVWYVVKDAHTGIEYGWPWGTFTTGTTERQYSDTGMAINISLYDRLLSLDRDRVDTPYVVQEGTRVDQALLAVTTEGLAYPPALLLEETDETVRTDRVWEPGTSRLRIANDLLDSINYFSLDTDGYGNFVATYRTPAASRAVVWEFEDTEERGIYSPDFTRARDSFNIPNKVVGYVEGDDESEGFSAVATDEDPESPWSFQERGEWITHVLENAEATSQPVLQDMVNRALRDAQQVGTTYEVTHDIIPLTLNDAVTFRRQTEDLSAKAVAQSFNISIGFSGESEMETTLREVTT